VYFAMERLRFRGKHPIPSASRGNTVLCMVGIWFAILVTAFIAAGVLTQLGWELPAMPTVKRVFRRGKSRVD
jgi:hypothetical protein